MGNCENTHCLSPATRVREPYPELVTVIDSSDSGNHLLLEEVFIGHGSIQYLEDEVALTTYDIYINFRKAACLGGLLLLGSSKEATTEIHPTAV